jgi:hypothetical protein
MYFETANLHIHKKDSNIFYFIMTFKNEKINFSVDVLTILKICLIYFQASCTQIACNQPSPGTQPPTIGKKKK